MDSATKLLSGKLTEIDPYEFEEFVASVLRLKSFCAEVTQRSRDYGVDIIAISPDGVRHAVQVKRFSEGNVGNQAIQILLGAMTLPEVNCTKAIVVTTSSFTAGARKVASACGVELWDGNALKVLVGQLLPDIERQVDEARRRTEERERELARIRNIPSVTLRIKHKFRFAFGEIARPKFSRSLTPYVSWNCTSSKVSVASGSLPHTVFDLRLQRHFTLDKNTGLRAGLKSLWTGDSSYSMASAWHPWLDQLVCLYQSKEIELRDLREENGTQARVYQRFNHPELPHPTYLFGPASWKPDGTVIAVGAGCLILGFDLPRLDLEWTVQSSVIVTKLAWKGNALHVLGLRPRTTRKFVDFETLARQQEENAKPPPPGLVDFRSMQVVPTSEAFPADIPNRFQRSHVLLAGGTKLYDGETGLYSSSLRPFSWSGDDQLAILYEDGLEVQAV